MHDDDFQAIIVAQLRAADEEVSWFVNAGFLELVTLPDGRRQWVTHAVPDATGLEGVGRMRTACQNFAFWAKAAGVEL